MRRVGLGVALLLGLGGAARAAYESSCWPGFGFGAFGDKGVTFSGNKSTTDSYDSSVGTYAQTHVPTGGNVGTNAIASGVVTLNGGLTLNGDVWIGPNGSTSTAITSNGGSTYQGSGAMPAALTLTPVTVPSLPNAAIYTPSIGSATTLAPGFHYGSISVTAHDSLVLIAGTYVFDGMSLAGQATLQVSSGPVVVYFASGSIDLTGGGVINSSGKATDLVILAANTVTSVSVAGGASAAFGIYAPNADISIAGNSDIYGSLVGKTVSDAGSSAIHYDKSLSSWGFSCSAVEISRASPVIASIGGTAAVVQGTYVSATGVQKTIAALTDIASFSFPYVRGHMRARTTASVTTTATSFASGTILWDAATTGMIPAASNTGCTTFNGTCRHLFTITSSPAAGSTTQLHPTMVPFDDSHASAIGALIVPTSIVSGIGASQWQTIVREVLAAPLGGVDRSTVAVIGSSRVAGSAARPQMVYFGADDGMLHAVCAAASGSVCPAAGTELWAFMPRTMLPLVRLNTQRVDGSVSVADAFGDFTSSAANGTRSWHTVLTFQTGFSVGSVAAVYALDVTDPSNPSVVWEYTALTAPGTTALGTGLTIASGTALVRDVPTNVAIVETNNGGSGGAGVVTTALQLETGSQLWQFGYVYPAPPRGVAADGNVPATGIPGGAAAVDLTGAGYLTDAIFGDLYGDLWRVGLGDGSSKTGATRPLFQFSGNKHPIGQVPAIYSNGNQEFAVFASGGYVDPVAASWSNGTQYAMGVKLTANPTTPLDENATPCGSCDVVLKQALSTGYRAYAQATVVGAQLFLPTDSTDINLASFATGGNSGQVLAIDLTGVNATTFTTVSAGAGSLQAAGTSLYISSGQTQVKLPSPAASASGPQVEVGLAVRIIRNLWMRVQ